MSFRTTFSLSLLLVLGCSGGQPAASAGAETTRADSPPSTEQAPELRTQTEPEEGQAQAYFAGGCFWCMEGPFESLPGVFNVISGYTDGDVINPTYEQVSSGTTGHSEGVRVIYDPAVISYAELLEVFWHNVDPTDAGGQFCDRGNQYRTGVYVQNEEERRLAEASKAAAAAVLGEEIVTPITDATPFYDAEDYHQNFYVTHPARYTGYRSGCGRDRRLQSLWGEAAAH